MAKTLIFGNQKGGVAKTTSTYNVATQLALKGNRVLMIDSDPQASLTIITGSRPEDYLERNLTALLNDESNHLDVSSCIISLNGYLPGKAKGTLSLIPTDIAMANGDLDYVSRPGNDRLLRNIIEQIESDFDYICIDCLPSLGIISINDIAASDYIIGCVEPTYQAFRGIGYYTDVISKMITRYRYQTTFAGVIVTKTTHSNDSKDLTSAIKNEYNVLGEIPLSVEVSKGELDGLPVSIRKPSHISSLQYSSIADKIIEFTNEV